MSLDQKKQKEIKCPSCGNPHVVGKFACNSTPCPGCRRAQFDKTSRLATVGANITPTVVGPQDFAREAICGTPANPRQALEALQEELTELGFQPDPTGAWSLDVGCVDSSTMSRIKVQLANGLASMPDPHIAFVAVLTQVTAPLDELCQDGRAVPPEAREVLVALRDRTGAVRPAAPARRHVAVAECHACKEVVPEWVVVNSISYCLECAPDPEMAVAP